MRAGEVVGGRYRVGELLGRGGMGSVWRARDERLHRDVALKFLEGYAGDEAQRRFRREAQTLARLCHPGLVRIYDHGVDRGEPFIVQEVVEGEDLAEVVGRGGLLDPSACRRLVRDLAEALAYLHGEGVLHRDIKPGNVMQRDDGRFLLMDFGLARAQEQTALTATGVLMGTPAYMPPEQLMGEPYDASADVYQVGLVLHEAATGVHLHGDVSDMRGYMLAMVAGKQVFTPCDAALPEGLRVIIGRCCSREPAERPRDGLELLRLRSSRPWNGSSSPTPSNSSCPGRRAANGGGGSSPTVFPPGKGPWWWTAGRPGSSSRVCRRGSGADSTWSRTGGPWASGTWPSLRGSWDRERAWWGWAVARAWPSFPGSWS